MAGPKGKRAFITEVYSTLPQTLHDQDAPREVHIVPEMTVQHLETTMLEVMEQWCVQDSLQIFAERVTRLRSMFRYVMSTAPTDGSPSPPASLAWSPLPRCCC